MSLIAPYSTIFYIADGTTQTYSYNFEPINAQFISADVKHTDGTITYDVPVTVDAEPDGRLIGTITFDPENTPESGAIILIQRTTPQEQATEYSRSTRFNPKNIETSFDLVVAMIQELSNKVNQNTLGLNIFQTQPFALDLMKEQYEGATLEIDYTGKLLKAGLHFKIESGNLNVSTDGQSWIMMPKSTNVVELKQVPTSNPDIKELQYRVGDIWYSSGASIAPIAEEALEKANQAIEMATTAIQTSTEAKSLATEANENAEIALNTARTANTKSDTAISTANTAQTTANTAITTAQRAENKADNAVQTAESADEKADQAVETAESADNKADNAVQTAGEAKTIAEGIEGKADQAIATANTASTTATNAYTKAEQAEQAVANKQDITDENLTTTAKTIVGAINELDARPSAPAIDNKTITKNTSDALQTVAVIDQADTSVGLKEWSGSEASYQALSVKESNTLYFTYEDVEEYWKEFYGYPLHVLYAIVNNLDNYKIYGNISQSGTPTPEAPIEVISVGNKTINLFDKNNVNWIKDDTHPYFFTSSTGAIARENSSSYEGERLLYIPCKPNTTYTVSFGNTYTKRLGTFPTVPVIGDIPSVYIADFTDQTKSITSGSTDNYLVVQLYINTNYNTSGARSVDIIPNVMIVEGSVAPSSYVPYGYQIPVVVTGTSGDPTTTPIYLNAPLHKIGDYADYIDYKNQQVVRNVVVKVFDGTESWTAATTTQGVYRYRFAPANAPKLDGGRGHCMSTHFFDISNVSTQDIGGVFTATTFLYFIPNQDIDTVEKWTAFLVNQYAAGTPVIVYYPLATATTEIITAPDIAMFEGTNTITTDTTVSPSDMYCNAQVSQL